MSSVLTNTRGGSSALSPRVAGRPATRELIALALLTAIALALRASQLHQTLGGDEVFTYQDIFGHSFGAVLSTVHSGGENSPPLFFLLAWLAAKLGNASIWIRLPSLLLGTATVAVVYAIGRESVGRAAGLIGAGIMALAPFAVFYGVEARPYATMTFFVALSTLALLRAVRPGASRGWWLLYSLAAAAAAYSHYTAIFLLAVQALWSLWLCRDRIAPALSANVAIVLLYLPWLPNLRGKELAVIGALYPLGVHRVLTDLLRPIPGHPAAPLHAIPTTAGMIVVALCLLGGVAALIAQARRSPGPGWIRRSPGAGQRPRLPAGLGGLSALTLATPVGLLLYSLLFTDLWLPRGLSASMPAAALVIGVLLAALPVRLAAVSVAAVAVVLGAGTLRSFDSAYTRGPFRMIAAYLDRSAKPRDPVALISLVGELAVREELERPHVFVPSLAGMWSKTPVDGRAYLVLDEQIKRIRGGATPQHAGFRLISRRPYAGALATELLVYRRTA